jgi:membrane protein
MEKTSSSVDPRLNRHEREVWERVSYSPVRNLWCVKGVTARTVARRTFRSALQDRLLGHASELGFYFLFSLFPTLICASSILGLAARSAPQIYDKLLHYFALVIPTSALGMVLSTFNQTTAASTSGKITFGLVAAIWSASAGISGLQDTMNAVYKLVDRRSFLKARAQAIGLTIVLIITVSLCLGSMFAGDLGAKWLGHHISQHATAWAVAAAVRLTGWASATIFLALSFALIYCWAPDLRGRCWRWFTPGTVIGMVGWLLASIGLRIYLHFFNNYSLTYGSLGAVIILLTWFYITGLMLLLGAEINSEIEAAAVEAALVHERRVAQSIAPAA